MSTPKGPERRADLLDRLQQTERRQDAAAVERKSAEDDRAVAEEMRAGFELLRQAAEELRAAAEETRRLNAQMRQEFWELLEELRRPAGPP